MSWAVLVRLLGGLLPLQRRIAGCRSPRLRQIYLMIWDQYLGTFGSWIGWNAQLHEIYFPHGMYGIFISGSARIGRGCVMFQHVTVGSNTVPGSSNAGAPAIGDHCYIGAGAKIIGGVAVGDHCRIGANAVVVQDVPPHCVVVSQPSRILPRPAPLDTRFYSRQGSDWCYWEDGRFAPATDPATVALLEAQFGPPARGDDGAVSPTTPR